MEAPLEIPLVINFRGHQRLVACVHAILIFVDINFRSSVHGIYNIEKGESLYACRYAWCADNYTL